MNNSKLKRLKVAQWIAGVGTICAVVGFGLMFSGSEIGAILVPIALLLGVISYLFGGLLNAIKMAGKIMKWGLLVAPFPACIMTLMISFVIGIMSLFFLPIIPIRKAYNEQCEKLGIE